MFMRFVFSPQLLLFWLKFLSSPLTLMCKEYILFFVINAPFSFQFSAQSLLFLFSDLNCPLIVYYRNQEYL